jgi:hypothetical protein
MSEFHWRGNGAGTKTDLNDGRNWVGPDLTTSYLQARYPGSLTGIEDDVYVDVAVTNGCITKCDQSNVTDYAAGAEIWRSLHVSSAYNKDIGAAAKFLKAKIREVVIEGTAAPNIYLAGWTTGYTPGLGSLSISGGANVQLAGSITDPVFLKGTIVCAASMSVLNSLTVGYVENALTDVTLTLGAGMTLPSTINIAGGVIFNSNALASLDFAAGEWTQSAGDLTAIVQKGGTINWNAGNIGSLVQYGGIATAAGDPGAKRIGTAVVYQGASLNLDNGQNNILVTGYIRNYGGAITTPKGYDIAPYGTTTSSGPSDAKLGISPQIVNNATVTGDAIYLGPRERLDVYCDAGSLPAGSAITFKLTECDTAGGAYADIVGKSVTLDDADDNKCFPLSVWAHELTAGKPYVKVAAINAAVADAVLAAKCVKVSC